MFKFQYDEVGYESTSKFDNETAIFFLLESMRGNFEAWHTINERKIRWGGERSYGLSAEDNFIVMAQEQFDGGDPEIVTFNDAVDYYHIDSKSFNVFDDKDELIEFISKPRFGRSSLVKMLEREGFIEESVDDDDD
jgi:hypothetical protein